MIYQKYNSKFYCTFWQRRISYHSTWIVYNKDTTSFGGDAVLWADLNYFETIYIETLILMIFQLYPWWILFLWWFSLTFYCIYCNTWDAFISKCFRLIKYFILVNFVYAVKVFTKENLSKQNTYTISFETGFFQ